MAFMKQLHHQMAQEKQTTENGAVGYHTSGKHLLDANFAVSSMRNWSEQRIVKLFAKAYYENPLLAVKWLFYLRDIRGNGMGERHTFRICLKWLMKNHADYAENVVPLIPEYGRFDDWLSLLDTPVHEKVIQSVKDQLMADLDAMKMGGQVSLLAKWMPSCNTSSEATKRQARVLYQALGMLELGIPENVVRYSCISERGRSADVRQSLVQNRVQSCDVPRESAVWQCISET